jgi:WD40 repeat protein
VALAISSQNILVTGSLEKHLRLRNIKTGKLIRSISGNSSISSVAFTRDGRVLAACGFDRNIRLWEATTGQEIGNFIGHCDRVSVLTFTEEGSVLISGGYDGTVCLWELNTGKLINRFKGHQDKITCLKINWQKKTMLTASSDGTVKIWYFQE